MGIFKKRKLIPERIKEFILSIDPDSEGRLAKGKSIYAVNEDGIYFYSNTEAGVLLPYGEVFCCAFRKDVEHNVWLEDVRMHKEPGTRVEKVDPPLIVPDWKKALQDL